MGVVAAGVMRLENYSLRFSSCTRSCASELPLKNQQLPAREKERPGKQKRAVDIGFQPIRWHTEYYYR